MKQYRIILKAYRTILDLLSESTSIYNLTFA